MARHALAGSSRQPLVGVRVIGKIDPAERLEVTLMVRRRAPRAFQAHLRRLVRGDEGAHCLDRADFAARYGADPGDLAAVGAFAAAHGLAVVQEDAARRSVVLSGSAARFDDAFSVRLQRVEHDGGTYRGRTGPIYLPDALKGIVTAVLGLDNRPQARPHFRLRRPDTAIAHPRRATVASFTPPQLAALYDFPDGDGAGQTIGIVELGGGYRPADLSAYFSGLGIGLPRVTAVSVDHAANRPTGDANGPDGEVAMDIEVAGAIAPGAEIVVYFAPNSAAGFVDALTTAVHDATNKPSVISISWGSPEAGWAAQARNALNEALQSAASMGITVCVASGDSGSDDGVGDGGNHVDFPASSPYALACGGTRLAASKGRITDEVVWNGGAAGGVSGGGVSDVFALPPWQTGLHLADSNGGAAVLGRRGVPDVAGNADPETGYEVLVDGNRVVVGGTSAVAPLWAGLIARINAARTSPAGFINTRLYGTPSALNDITQGDNGAFAAGPGWDACSGLGSPNGKKVAGAL